ncbi:MAG: hypothetical protein C0523_00185, partial [Cytophaga sp.]|nr:hypothetical protein [Cytophaga sp.]
RVAFVCLLVVAGTELFAQQAELFNPMKDALKTGNAKEVVKFFNTSVDMDIEGTVDSYSKTQAEFVLRDFFKKHPPTDFNIVHTGSSKGGLQYAIGRYNSNGENYNVMLRVKEVNKVNLIHEINFVKE